MTASVSIKKGQRPTEKQIKEIIDASGREPTFDEDAPEYNYEQLKRYREAAIKRRNEAAVTIFLPAETYSV